MHHRVDSNQIEDFLTVSTFFTSICSNDCLSHKSKMMKFSSIVFFCATSRKLTRTKMASPPQKRAIRTRLDLKDKLKLFDEYKTLDIAGCIKKYNVCTSAVYKIIQNQNDLKQQFYSNRNLSAKQKVKESAHEKLNKVVYELFLSSPSNCTDRFL